MTRPARGAEARRAGGGTVFAKTWAMSSTSTREDGAPVSPGMGVNVIPPPDDAWIDRAFANSPWRVRQLAGTGIRTLASFATREQAEAFLAALREGRQPEAPPPGAPLV